MTVKQEAEVRFLFRMYILYFCLRNLYAHVSFVCSSLFAFLALSVREQMLSPAWSCLGPGVDEIPAVALLPCVLAPGEVLVLLLIPSMALPGVCSLQRGSTVHWSCSALPDGFPCGSCLTCTTFSSIWIEMLSCGNPGILQQCCLRAAEVLNFVFSFQLCLLPHQSSIIMFQFPVLPPGIWFLFPWCSLTCPRFLSMGYLSLLDLPFPFSLWGARGGQRLLALPSCAGTPWDVSLHLGSCAGCDAPGSEQRAAFWGHLALSMMKTPSSCLL